MQIKNKNKIIKINLAVFFLASSLFFAKNAKATLIDNASFISYTNLPWVIGAGQSFTASIVMYNNGDTTWTTAVNYKLGARITNTWGINSLPLPGSVAPGSYVTFTRTFTAPASLGSYVFKWSMKKGTIWFVDDTDPWTIEVVDPAATYPLSVSPDQSVEIKSDDGFIDCKGGAPQAMGDCSYYYPLNTSVILEAIVDPSRTFSGSGNNWSGGCDEYPSDHKCKIIAMDEPYNVSAWADCVEDLTCNGTVSNSCPWEMACNTCGTKVMGTGTTGKCAGSGSVNGSGNWKETTP